MSILIDKLPESVTIGGKDYKINTDFRVSILFETMMLDEDFPDELKGTQAIELYFTDDIPPTEYWEEALQKIIEFYSCGKSQQPNNKKGQKSIQEIYSFEYDDDYIFSAFYQQYGIDLTTVNMHWWKFKALFKSLSERCKIVEIMNYRIIDISKVSKEQQNFYRSMKKLYALPLSQSVQDRLTELENQLK